MWQRTCQAVTSWQLHHHAQHLPWEDILPSTFSKKSFSSIQCHGSVWWQTFLGKPVPHLSLSFLNSQIFTKELCGCRVFVDEMGPVFRSRGNYDWWRFLPLLVNCLTSLRWYKMSCQKVIWDIFWEKDFHLQLNYNIHLGFQHLFLSGGIFLRPPTQLLEAYLGRGLNLADATQCSWCYSSSNSFLLCPFSLCPLLQWKNLANMYPDVAVIPVGLSCSASAVLQSHDLSTNYKLSSWKQCFQSITRLRDCIASRSWGLANSDFIGFAFALQHGILMLVKLDIFKRKIMSSVLR